jgi:hypothetical protein
MDDITLSILVILATGLLVALIFFIGHRRNRANEESLIQIAAENGWQYEPIRKPLASGYRMTAPGWTLESISESNGGTASPGSSNITQTTVWQANIPGTTLLIGPRLSQANLGALGDMLLQKVFDRYLGNDGQGISEVQAGSEPFRKNYMVYAQDPQAIRISPALESALLNWRGPKPHIKRTSKGIEIETGKLLKADELKQVTGLGKILVSHLS